MERDQLIAVKRSVATGLRICAVGASLGSPTARSQLDQQHQRWILNLGDDAGIAGADGDVAVAVAFFKGNRPIADQLLPLVPGHLQFANVVVGVAGLCTNEITSPSRASKPSTCDIIAMVGLSLKVLVVVSDLQAIASNVKRMLVLIKMLLDFNFTINQSKTNERRVLAR